MTAPTFTPGVIGVYARTGAFVTSWGKEGRGPGEYRHIIDVQATATDSVIVVDGPTSRVSVLDSAGTFARAFAVRGILRRALPLSTDSILVYALAFPGPDKGTLHVFAGGYEPALTFPESVNGARDVREIAATDSFIVSARRTRYAFELFRRDGQRLREVTPEVDWFKGFSPLRVTNVRGTGASLLVDVARDSGDRVWTLSARENEGAARFEAAALAEPNAGFGLSLALQDSVYDHYLDLVDLTTGCSLRGMRLRSGVYTGFAGNRRLVSARELSSGGIVIDVWRLNSRSTEDQP